MTDPGQSAAASVSPQRRAWSPEGGSETAEMLRLLARQPWLLTGRDDDAIAKVRQNQPDITSALGRLGWPLAVERDFIRLGKSPPVRCGAWTALAPSPLTCTWFFLLVAASEAMPPAVALGKLVAAAKTAAAEADITVTGDISERRAIVQALRLLDDRGVVEQVDGDTQGYLHEDEPPVLLAIHHTRLLHVIANPGASDVAADPAAWLRQVESEPDPARRMRRRLVDDTVVHASDLDEAEADWLSRRVRGDDGEQLAKAFGLHLERRSEGAAFVVPSDAFRYDRELGPTPFPAAGTVPHAALLLCGHAQVSGASAVDRTGWLGLPEADIHAYLAMLAGQFGAGRGGWRTELAQNPKQLAAEVRVLLTGLDLVRAADDNASTWWFSPVTARWVVPDPPSRQPPNEAKHDKQI
jgi:uncharacterized protein (TIGR02678 family)